MDPVQDQKNLNQNPEEAPPAPPSPAQPVLAPEPAPVPPSPAAPPVASPPAPAYASGQVGPPQQKKKLPVSMFGIAAILLLVVSIPVGVYLVRQTQELRGRAYEAADCDKGDRGGLKEETQDCDVNTNQLVQVFVCNNEESLPGSPTGQECPQAPAPPAGGPPAAIGSDTDGPGGCCNQDAAANSPQGCRQGSGFNEVCDVSNGACQSGFSCRSIAGCTQDSDCGPGNECKDSQCQQIPPPTGQYISCASWGFSDDPDNTANPNCEKEPINGFSCRRTDGVAVCAYRDGTWHEGQQGNCKNLGNGTIEINISATIDEYHCPNQTSSTESCSEGKTNRGLQGPGTYTVGGDNCGGHQIDAKGLCGSYTFRGACSVTPPGGGPAIVLQCTAVEFYDTSWNLLSNPQIQLGPGQAVKISVVGSNIKRADFRINDSAWQAANCTTPAPASKPCFQTNVSSGQFKVEARVYK